MQKHLLIFDCDGVIVESENLAIGVVQKQLINLGIEITFKETEHYFLGRSLKDGIISICKDYKVNLPKSFARNCKQETINLFKEELEPVNNFHFAMQYITNKKCVASGSDPERLNVSLGVTNTNKYFKNVFSTVSVKRGKPYPDIFLYAAKKMNYPVNSCIVIEDSKAGVTAGIAAGMKVIWYKVDMASEDEIPTNVIVINDMSELPNVVNNLEASTNK